MSSNESLMQKSTKHVGISLSELTCITSHARSLIFSTQEIEIVPEGIALVGSVVVCEVVSVGAHDKVEKQSGRYVRINPGDRIMGVMGNRYSTSSMHGGLPGAGISLPREQTVDLLSTGGLIGECYASPSYLGSPTSLRILGLAYQQGEPLKMSPPARFRASNLQISCPLILLAGTSATVGKTKFAAKLAHFLSHDLGKTIAATKLAGAGNFDDLLNIGDAGAKYTFDFVDAGLASTYGDSADFKKMVVEVAKGILNYLGEKQPDAIIAELGGDILGANVPAILEDREVLSKTSTIVLVPSDTFAALGAITYLHDRGFDDSIIDVAQPLKILRLARDEQRTFFMNASTIVRT